MCFQIIPIQRVKVMCGVQAATTEVRRVSVSEFHRFTALIRLQMLPARNIKLPAM